MFRRLIATLALTTVLLGATYAVDPIQNNSPHTLGQYSCDVTSSVVYYVGTNNIYPVDLFTASTSHHWRISVVPADSWYSIYNNGLYNAPGFQFASNGKPLGQGPVIAVKSTSAASVGTNVPSGYQRSTIAAQIVYHLKRWSYVAGPFPNPIYFTPVGGSTQNVTINTSPNASATQQDNECRNIHVGFCGDQIVDNGTSSSSDNINAPLNGGEACDDGNTDPFDSCNNCALPFCGDGYVQPGEACDDGNTTNGDGCEANCTLTTGVCGGVNGDTIYDFNNNGDMLNQNSPGLCTVGVPTNFTYNTQTHTWSWTCTYPNAGQSGLCQAIELRCGNNVVETNEGEQCDGSGQAQCSSGQTCNACACISNPSNGVCGALDNTTIYDFNNNGDALNQNSPGLCANGTVANFTYNSATHTWSWSCTGANGGSSDSCQVTELRCGNNVVETNQGEQCDGNGQAQCSSGQSCNACACTSNPNPGVCGNVDNTTIYDFNNNGDALNQNSPGLCAAGTVSLFTYNTQTHMWSWQCVGTDGQTDICGAIELRCGNNVVETNEGEQCDGSGQAQCAAGQTCNACACTSNPNPGVCGSVDTTTIYDFNNNGDALNQNSPGLCANGTVANFTYNTQTHTWSWQCVGTNGANDSCQATELRCGNNVVETNEGEQCDGSGQAQCSSGQSCNACICTSTPNNGICGSIDTTTIYDFNNSGDALNQNSPGLCANGTVANFTYNTQTHTWSWSCTGVNGGSSDSCQVTELRCGNGVVENGEVCDDGNTNNNDTCTTTCTIPTQSSCESLTVTTTSTQLPTQIAYNCQGTGTHVQVQLFGSNGTLISGSTAPVGSFPVTQPDTYKVVCSYDGITNTNCQKSVTLGGYCEDLTAKQTTGTNTYEFSCMGEGDNFLILITNDKQEVIAKAEAKNEFTYTHTFSSPGTYTATCYVDGTTNTSCKDGKTTTFTTQSAPSLNKDLAVVATTLYHHAVEKEIKTIVKGIGSTTITPVTTRNPSVVKPDFEKKLDDIKKDIDTKVTEPRSENCTNTCKETVTITGGGGGTTPSCVLTTTPTNTTINGTSATVTGSCAYVNMPGVPTINCGNGTTLSGDQGACTYTGKGSWTMSCQLDGAAIAGCTKSVQLSSNGGSSTSGNPSSIKCGNGKIDAGEECDDGAANGIGSICTASCKLKGVNPGSPNSTTPTDTTPPKCAFVDPPSIQLGEILPFWWDMEDDEDVMNSETCDASRVGKVAKLSLKCHFTIEAPGGVQYKIEESCTEDKLKKVGWYRDLQQDLNTTLASNRGQSYIDTSLWKTKVYGEYTIALDKITYALCTETKAATSKDKATYAMAYNKSYEGRVCQFNFAVTAPYLIQKGTSLSSFADDVQTLKQFRRLDGKTILEVSNIKLLERTSFSDAFATMKKTVYAATDKAVQNVGVSSPIGALAGGFKKVPSQELYVINEGFTLRHNGKQQAFNGGKPTTLVVKGAHTVNIAGSLPGNILLIAPEATVVFVNQDCDEHDTIEATIVAQKLTTTLPLSRPNKTLTDREWCTDGQLVVKGVLVSQEAGAIEQIRDVRRSTLNNWFDGSTSKENHIYAGASLRIESRPATWNSQPPLATKDTLFFRTQSHDSAESIALPDEILQALLLVIMHVVE